MKNNDQEWIDQFKRDMKKLDDSHTPKIPDQWQLMNTLNEFKVKHKRAFKRELALFLLTALVILTSYMVFALKLPSSFIWIQGLALLATPTIYFAEKRKKKRVSEYEF
ncbi:YxlC family protein [Bacillus niameyensis]|uniref:YxlC family protein n=1 Tax=Bacillus niameyensis TaxID=1522308 RepID=UPI0007804757|nr:YxlC family protein [Bacillus niameyensis]